MLVNIKSNFGGSIVNNIENSKKKLTSEDAQTIFNWIKLGLLGVFDVFIFFATTMKWRHK